jgi:hypothetical protein
MPEREAVYGQDEGGRSAGDVLLEGANDLAHRCVMPWDLGRAISRLAEGTQCNSDNHEEEEENATLQQREALDREVSRRRQAALALRHAVQVTTALALGLRSIRIEYASRISAWKAHA